MTQIGQIYADKKICDYQHNLRHLRATLKIYKLIWKIK